MGCSGDIELKDGLGLSPTSYPDGAGAGGGGDCPSDVRNQHPEHPTLRHPVPLAGRGAARRAAEESGHSEPPPASR